ncbi:DUF5719 family protein [Streptomyces sp. TR06-5]|uniref:DUF5719 family protein n=1 Tax=unclassified Streptomyces TaxID=2593676 RepID=UPI0039A15DC1
MNRTTLSLIGASTVLAAVTGLTALTAPDPHAGTGAPSAARLPVQRSTLLCPQPSASDLAETRYTAHTPPDDVTGEGEAALLPLAEKDDGLGGDESGPQAGGGKEAEPFLPLKKPGTPVTDTVGTADAPALAGSAEGPLAPGWTVQQTTVVSAGSGRGMYGTGCQAPDTDFWFPGASTAEGRQDFVHLTNPDDSAAVVDLGLHGEDGAIESDAGEALTVPPRSTLRVLLSTLTDEPVADLTVHGVVRTGRVSAQVQAADEKTGGDWLPTAGVPRPTAVIPGIPADATSVRLVVHAPGASDADLAVRLATPSGTITPAGAETLHVKSGTTSAVDLDSLTQGAAASLSLAPTDDGDTAPVVAAVRVTRGKGDAQETAFIPATTPVEKRATAAGNRTKDSTLSLLALGRGAEVRVTASAGTDGGSPQSRTYTLKQGTTTDVEAPRPEDGKGPYALTVERVSGGEVYAARTLARKQNGVPMFTVQALPDDRGRVAVPRASQDLTVLNQ